MSDKRVRKYLQAGTMECMLLCMGVALVVGIGFITIGFWKTVLLAILLIIGLFIGGVSNKREVLSDWYNRLFPARAKQEATRRQLAEQVRRTVSNQDFDRDEEPVRDEDAGEFLDSLSGKAEEAAEAFGEQAEETLDTLKDKAEDVFEAAADKAEDVCETVCDKAEDVFEAAAEKAEDVFEAGKETVTAAADEAAGVGEAAAEAVEAFAGDAKEAAQDALDDVGAAAKDALDELKKEE